MNPRPTRPFGLGDLAALVAATAVMLAAARFVLIRIPPGSPTLGTLDPALRRTLAMTAVAFVAACLTAFQVVARLRRPRPRLRRVARQPGAAATLAAGLAIAVTAARIGTAFLRPILGTIQQHSLTIRIDPLSPFDFTRIIVSNGSIAWEPHPLAVALIQPCGFAVAGAWLTLALSGRWRPEPSWIDRLGRGIGVAWIALTLAATAGF